MQVNMIADVIAFHKTFGHPILPKPAIPDPQRQVLRMRLFRDEYVREFVPAWDHCAEAGKANLANAPNHPLIHARALAEMGDVVADLIYYLIGLTLEYGIPLAEIWQKVQQTNMAKLWTKEEVDSVIQQDPMKSMHWRFVKADHNYCPDAERCYVAYDETGKVQKPPSWKEPNLVPMIQERMV